MLWQKIDEKLIKDGWRKVTLKTFILPDGRKQDFEIFKEGESVCVLALTKENKVILTKQFRPGPEKEFLELPGGGVNVGKETKEQAIERELLEETGYVGNIKFVASGPNDAYSSRIRHCFVATDCYKKQEPKSDDTEFIVIVEMTIPDFRNHLRSGQLTDVQVGYLGLDYLNLL